MSLNDFEIGLPCLQSDAANLPPPFAGARYDADGGKLPSNGLSMEDLAKMSKAKKKKVKKNGAR